VYRLSTDDGSSRMQELQQVDFSDERNEDLALTRIRQRRAALRRWEKQRRRNDE
jgi:hypothetical protein